MTRKEIQCVHALTAFLHFRDTFLDGRPFEEMLPRICEEEKMLREAFPEVISRCVWKTDVNKKLVIDLIED